MDNSLLETELMLQQGLKLNYRSKLVWLGITDYIVKIWGVKFKMRVLWVFILQNSMNDEGLVWIRKIIRVNMTVSPFHSYYI